MPKLRRSKIVATLGPASSDPVTLQKMLQAGLNVARINLSHGTHETHRKLINAVRTAAAKQKKTISILFDLQGPKMRIGRLRGSGPVQLKRGAPFAITTKECVGDETRVSTPYTNLVKDVKKDDTILIDDGRIKIKVVEVKDNTVHCTVIEGGLLGEHKGINLPGVAISAPALTRKDMEDLKFAKEMKVDYIALSFVRSKQDVVGLRKWLARNDFRMPIIAKIERAEALDKLDEILDEADGVMVARGDLGVELSLARVPVLQKSIIEKSNRCGRLVITATQMLETMIEKPVPTRAEATDIANAIFDHTDAVMLSGETASGKYPVEAVKTMSEIIQEAEQSEFMYPSEIPDHIKVGNPVTHMVVHAAARAARDPEVKGIMVFSLTGTTAHALSKQRPTKPIWAITPFQMVAQRMALYWGVEPFMSEFTQLDTDSMIAIGEKVLRDSGKIKKGDLVVVIAGTTQVKGATNMMKLLTIGI